MAAHFHRGDKKLINRWAMYDWANSVYSLSIATAIFPIYYIAATDSHNNGQVAFFGGLFQNDALYSLAISVSFLIVALLAPMLAPLADYRGNKLSYMKFFCYLGACSCASLYFFTGDNPNVGIVAFAVATIGFASSLVYYNAYLKEIVDESEQDRVSAKGFSLGYIGSVILLLANLIMVLKPHWFGFKDEWVAFRISFVTVGLWWAGFAQIPFNALKRFHYRPPVPDEVSEVERRKSSSILGGYKELRKVWFELKQFRSLRNFLLAFFLYNSAVQTVMYLASVYGNEVIFKGDKNGQSKLIACVLVIQLVAIAGAMLFSRLSRQRGNVYSLSVAILIWIVICICAYFITTQIQFYALAFCVGMVMGGIQAISRSTYSKLIPPTRDTASYFSFYDSTEKIATVLGTALYAIIVSVTGEQRNVVFFLLAFFMAGYILLRKIKSEQVLAH